ncbi:MAG TPA: hypothetical protein EYN96_09905, partial [Candidatus Hydrogenedentes bacterium]|nr:hypothetical protein [Candidatus Hydrogenedentota bacterium]
MKKPLTTIISALAVVSTLLLPARADSTNDPVDEYVSTENIDHPFGDPEDDYTESHIRVFPLVKHDRKGKEGDLKVLHAPLVTVFEANRDEDEHKVELVYIPFFTLAQSKSKKNGEFDNKFLKLPIVGSLFRHKRQGNKEKIRFLIFSHTRT